ncbi:hypothetical protein [Pseudonocardia sp. WMMC193]|uniref:hypothetical protein n=1 Tax=Pseudonocardia sp. WMMC193 TaxID=2911965 RepID=UPI001F16DCFF|nr:hypothetical protein [Pseudonocardia sp. WMMC193]MCF7551002.1 hypothetical protein [Pseudonocardia sp. WMMC193]
MTAAVRVNTRALIGFLSDLIHTAFTDPRVGGLSGVLVHTSRGEWGVEPGEKDLLCGASTTRLVAGHTYTDCQGQLDGPSLWPVRDCQSIIAVFKSSAKADEHHTVDVDRDGQTVTVCEDPNLFNDGLSLSFSQMKLHDFPGITLYQHLDRTTAHRVEVAAGRIEEALPRTDFTAGAASAFVKVAERRKATMSWYRTHQREPILVEIGPHYRGVLMPQRYEPEGDERRPGAEAHPPDLADLARRIEADKAATKPGVKTGQLAVDDTPQETSDGD